MSNREETRTKATLNWTLSGDALRPKDAPFGFIGQNPFLVTLAPGQGRLIRTGISANVPLLVYPTRSHNEDLRPEKEGQSWPVVLAPGDEINVVIVNQSKHVPISIEDKEGLVYITPLVFTGTTDVT
jgi:hypothetical protein